MSRWRDAIVRYRWLFAVLALALLLDVLFFTGYYGFDDKDYTWAAHQIAHGNNFLLPRASNYELAAVRLAFNSPLAIVYRLSGGSVAWMCGFQMLYHLGCVVIAYALARSVANERTGRIAAVLVAACPLLYNFAGVMMPDVALAMWTGLSLLLLVRAIHRAQHPEEPGWRSSRLFLAAGVALGIGYSVKATAILLCFPSAIVIIAAFPSLREPWKWIVPGAWLALGVAIVLLLELVIFRAVTGDWLSQLTVAQDSTNWDFPKWLAKQGKNPFGRILVAAGGLRNHMPITFLALAVGLVAHTISRKRNIAIVTFAWFNFLYLTVGTVSLTRYMPQPLFPRYFTLIIIPMAIALACAITQGLEWYATWTRRPSRITPRVAAVVLIVVGVGTTIYEVKANVRYAGTQGNSVWARSFVLAYEKAKRDYPDYPIVLSVEASYTLLPLVVSDVSDRIYWQAPGEPWGNDHKTTPKPPFVFLDWTRGSTRSGLARIPGVDLEHVSVETVAIVYADPAFGLGRLRAALSSAPINKARTWDTTTIQLVKPSTKASDAAPMIQVHTERGIGVGVINDQTGVTFQWDEPTKFEVSFFDNDDHYFADTSITDKVDPPAKEATLTIGASTLRGADVTGSIEVIAYDDDDKIVDRTTQPIAVKGSAVQPIVATLHGDIHEYRVRGSIASSSSGGLRLDPFQLSTVPAEATARIAAAPKPVALVSQGKGEVTIREEGAFTSVRYQEMPRFAIQYFDGRNYRRMPSSETAKLRAEVPIKAFVVSGAMRQPEGAPVTADVEVFSYGEDRELAGQAHKRLTLGPTSTEFSITVTPTRLPAAAYRVRVWLEGKGPVALELAPLVVTPIR